MAREQKLAKNTYSKKNPSKVDNRTTLVSLERGEADGVIIVKHHKKKRQGKYLRNNRGGRQESDREDKKAGSMSKFKRAWRLGRKAGERQKVRVKRTFQQEAGNIKTH